MCLSSMIMIDNNLAIYIHIPFCVKKCSYCDFLSAPPLSGQERLYIDALKREILSLTRYAEQYTVNTIFIGGGTPSLLDASFIEEIIFTLRNSFESVRAGSFKPNEVTIECNPGTVSLDKLIKYRNAGINRLSMGLQSASEKELRLLGRIHSYTDWCLGMKMAEKAGFDNINVDLISGIPGQSVKDFANTLEKVIEYEPQHISVYSLIIEEGTPFYNKYRSELLNEEEQDAWEKTDRKIYDVTLEVLKDAGYNRYEISNYSKHGYECRHNIVYWELGDYLGIGIGAASMIDNVRYKNTDSIEDYIYKGNIIVPESIQKLSVNERMSEYIVLGLRKTDGISIAEFENLFGRKIFDVYGDELKKWISYGMLEEESERIHCSTEGLSVCNRIMVDFI